MSRISYFHRQCSFYAVYFFLIGFIFGISYWQTFLRIQCISSITPRSQLKSSFYDHFQYRTIETCRNESSELFLTIAILSSYERLLIYFSSIINTWILTATNEIEIILFVEEKSFHTEELIENFFFQLNENLQIKSCLFLVKLKYVQNTYPPQKKSFYAMKFLYTFYQQRTLWLLRLDDNAYVNIDKLIPWLKSIDHQQTLYIGQSGSGRQNGSAIYFPSGEYFCMGGSGVILSQETLIKLGPWLDYCLNNEILTKHEDVELGRCILKYVHISCTNAYNSKSLFYHHYGPSYFFGHDLTSSILSQALIIHPIKHPNIFRQIFAFYLREKVYFNLFKISNNLTILSNMKFNLIRDIDYQSIDARWKSYIQENVRLYLEKIRMIWYKRSFNWTLTHGNVLFCYHRVIPSYGLQSIVEVQLNARLNSISSIEFGTARKRFHIRQLFSNKHHLNYREIIQTNDSAQQLNLIVASSNQDEGLKRFLYNFQNEILNSPFRQKYYTLTILYFSQNNPIIDFIYQLFVRYPSIIRLSVINQTNISDYRRLSRQLALKLFTDNQLLFFLDINLIFTGQALDNTRRLMIHQLSISSCTVYFPIIFSVFSNMFVVDENPMMEINSKNGLFSIDDFGNIAVRKGDLDGIGEWEMNNQEFQRLSSECSIFRTVEPGLKHYYHKKMYQDADINLLGSQVDMVNYLYDNQIIQD